MAASYDAVASAYDSALRNELDNKPLDRGLISSFAELAGAGTIADLGCGPGHVTRFLALHHSDVIGIDLSPRMVATARDRAPGLTFIVATMLQLPTPAASWAGAAALYSIIHLTPGERAAAFGEMARAIRPGGWLLLAFHVSSEQFTAGHVNRLTEWFGKQVQLDGYFIEPRDVMNQLNVAGFDLVANIEREPLPEVEYPSPRCYLLAQRRA